MRTILPIFSLFWSLNLSAQCPVCEVNLPDIPIDTIYLGVIPDGAVGQMYEEDISFRLPISTTYADPSIEPPLDINAITITSITNLPPGIQAQSSQLEFDLPEESDGCVRFCGTPLLSDTFYIEVNIDAQVFIATQSTTLYIAMYVAPASEQTELFGLEGNVACGSSLVNFENLISSPEQEGISYYWDFGNGDTSTLPFPEPVLYTEGEYEVSLEVSFDTVGYLLESILIEDLDCTDLFGDPDLYITIENFEGEEVYTSGTIENVEVPYVFDIPSLYLDVGSYTMTVYDDDPILDVNCGTILFTRESLGFLTQGDLTVNLDIIHPTSSNESEGNVTIYAIPNVPIIASNVLFPACENEEIELSVNWDQGVQWYLDNQELIGKNEAGIIINNAGFYQAEVTSKEGCTSLSEGTEVSFLLQPPAAVYTFANNVLELFEPLTNPELFSFQWLLEGENINGANKTSLCIVESGNYTLQITEIETGCVSQFTNYQVYLPSQDCITSNNNFAIESSIFIAPHPVTLSEQSYLFFPAGEFIALKIFSNSGMLIHQQNIEFGAKKIALPQGLKPQLYWIKLTGKNEILTLKFLNN